MKTKKCPVLLLMALGAAALLTGGCASIPGDQGNLSDYSGDLFYYDAGYTWLWQDGSGWCYEGLRGNAGAPEPRQHHPPPPGSQPPHEPGQYPPCYVFISKSGTVLISLDGKSYGDVGVLGAAGFIPALTVTTGGRIALHEGGFGGGTKIGAGGSPISFHVAARPISAVHQFLSHPGFLSTSSPIHSGLSTTSGGYSRSSINSSWSGGSSRGGGWSGGGGGGSHFSGGGGGGDRGGGGGGGDRGGGGGGGSSSSHDR